MRHLDVSLTALCPDQSIVRDVCSSILNTVGPEDRVIFTQAVDLILDAKMKALVELRKARGGPLPLDDLFQKHVWPLIGEGEQSLGWRALLLELSLLLAPCQFLIVDYYIWDRDYVDVVDRWNKRPHCVTLLRAATAKRLEALRD